MVVVPQNSQKVNKNRRKTGYKLGTRIPFKTLKYLKYMVKAYSGGETVRISIVPLKSKIVYFITYLYDIYT